MAINAPQQLQLAGYQGADSVLTAGLHALSGLLLASSRDWQVHMQADVTSGGVTAGNLFKRVESSPAQLCYLASGYLSSRVSELGVLDVPFSVCDRAAALACLDGDVGRILTCAVEEKTGYKVLGFWDNGFRHISNAIKPLYAASDCVGMSIRTLDNANYRDMLAALGFNPMTTDVKDLVHVVRNGGVQAQENPLTNLTGFSIWQHHPYVSLTGHYFGVVLLVCNKPWFGGLSKAHQESLAAAAQKATNAQRALAALEDARAIAFLQNKDVNILGSHELDQKSMLRATAAVGARQRAGLPNAALLRYLQVA